MTQPQKKMFKVLASIPRHDKNGDWLMKVGSAYENRDGSINVYLDVVPVGTQVKLQIRELDARDLAQREAYRTAQGPNGNATGPAASRAATAFPYEADATHGTGSAGANEAVPF